MYYGSCIEFMVHKSSYCKCSLAWCQARTFLLFRIWTHPLQMREYPPWYAGTDKNKKSHYSTLLTLRGCSHAIRWARMGVYFHKICTWMFLPDFENWTFSRPTDFSHNCPSTSVYHFRKKSTQFGSNWMLFSIIWNIPNLCNLGSFISDENPEGTRMLRGYQARPKIHVIRVVFQDQALY